MDDWQVGDLALCVANTHPVAKGIAQVRIGAVYTVERVGSVNTIIGERVIGVSGVTPIGGINCGYPSSLFRKIRPLTDGQRDSFLAELDEPITPARRVAPVGAALNARVGHLSPLACPASSLPGPSADDTPRHADGSGLLFNRAHDAEVSNG